MALLAIDGHFPLFASFIPSLSLSLKARQPARGRMGSNGTLCRLIALPH
jgi:hypothetical protein